jgi:predicted methyltransferase
MTANTLRAREASSRALLRLVLSVVAFHLFASPVVAQARGGGGLPPRDEWQRVPDIIAALGVTAGQRVADIAAGQGYLTKPLSKAVGKSGRVYAVEISDDARRALTELAARESLTNVEVVAGSETDPRLPAQVDGAVILNSYHELTDYKAILTAIFRTLRPGGRLVLVDNTNLAGHDSTREGQVRRHAIDPSFVDAELRAAGFEIADRQDGFIVQPFPQWLIVARRPPSAKATP